MCHYIIWVSQFSTTASVFKHSHTILPLDKQSSPHPFSFIPTTAILSGSKPLSIHRTSTTSYLLNTPLSQLQ